MNLEMGEERQRERMEEMRERVEGFGERERERGEVKLVGSVIGGTLVVEVVGG